MFENKLFKKNIANSAQEFFGHIWSRKNVVDVRTKISKEKMVNTHQKVGVGEYLKNKLFKGRLHCRLDAIVGEMSQHIKKKKIVDGD